MPTRSKKKQSDQVFEYGMHRIMASQLLKVPAVGPKRSTRSANKKTTEDDLTTTTQEE